MYLEEKKKKIVQKSVMLVLLIYGNILIQQNFITKSYWTVWNKYAIFTEQNFQADMSNLVVLYLFILLCSP